jgi:UBX domain-containing protein 1
MERDSESSDENVQAKPAAVKTSRTGSNIATISSIRNAEPKEDEKGQAYYAGGSEHSGQQGNYSV